MAPSIRAMTSPPRVRPARMLLDYLGEQLRAQGYVALLSSSQTDEPEPQAWHRHLGFTSGGIIENIADEGIGEVVFRLEL